MNSHRSGGAGQPELNTAGVDVHAVDARPRHASDADDGRTEYKKYVQFFEVQEDIPYAGAAFGKTKANPQFNPERYKTHDQYFFDDDHFFNLAPISGLLETTKYT